MHHMVIEVRPGRQVSEAEVQTRNQCAVTAAAHKPTRIPRAMVKHPHPYDPRRPGEPAPG